MQLTQACNASGGTSHDEMKLMLEGYGLTTANILYRMPDHPSVLQTFIWQALDVAPDFPRLEKFLAFWKSELDGPLHSVQFAHRRLISPGVWRHVDGEFPIH